MSKNIVIDLVSFDTKEKLMEGVLLLKKKLQNLRLRTSLGVVENGLEIRKTRKNIARLLTKLNSMK